MLCAAIDIGSNTTRVLVAEPQEGQLRKVMEQRAYTRIGKASQHDGAIDAEKVAEVAEVVATQVRLAEELGAEAIRTVATAAIREAANRDEVVSEINRVAGRRGRGPQRARGGTPGLHRRHQDPGPPGRGRGRGRRRRRWLLRGRRGQRHRRAALRPVVQDRLRARSPTTSWPRSALAAELRGGARPHRRRSSTGSSSSSPARRSPSAAAPPRSGRWSARCSSTRRWSGRSGC